MKVSLLFVVLLIAGFASCQESTSASPSHVTTSAPQSILGIEGFVKSFTQAFEVLMRQVSNLRGIFVGMGQEIARITYNNTIAPIIPGSNNLLYQTDENQSNLTGSTEETISVATDGTSTFPIPSFVSRFVQIYQRWMEETGTALTSLFREVFNMYSDAVAALIQRGQITRDQVVRGFKGLRQSLESFTNSISAFLPNINLNNTITNIFNEMNQNITNFLENFTFRPESTTVTVAF